MLPLHKRSAMFFPAFLNLTNKKILVIGGGKIAADKIEKLLDFTQNITILAPTLNDRTKELIQRYDLALIQRPYQKSDIDGFFLVIVAVDDLELQKEIFQEAQNAKVLVNSVDSTKYCDFIFPSYIKEKDLVIAFSTSGASPALSKYLRRAIQKLLPPDIGEFVEKLKNLRKSLPKGKKRMELLDQKAKEYIDRHFKDSQ